MKSGLTIVNSGLLRATADQWDSPEQLFKVLTGKALRVLLDTASSFPTGGNYRQALRVFDILLYVLGENQVRSVLFFNTKRFEELQGVFYGALCSTTFSDLSAGTKTGMARSFYNLLSRLAERLSVKMPLFTPNTIKLQSDFLELFSSQPLNNDAIKSLMPYVLTDIHGVAYQVRLQSMRTLLGDEFTDTMYSELRDYAFTKAKDSALRDFANNFSLFIETEKGISASRLHDKNFVSKMLVRFIKYHFSAYHEVDPLQRNGKLTGLQKMWSRYLVYLEYLFERKVLARPDIPLPVGNPKLSWKEGVLHRRAKVQADGSVKFTTEKLITPVPLHLTDSEATKLIFEKLKGDNEIVEGWLVNYFNSVFHDFDSGIALCEKSQITEDQTEFELTCFNPAIDQHALSNVIKYFKVAHGGYCNTLTGNNIVFETRFSAHFNKTEVSRLLGLPDRTTAQMFIARMMQICPSLTEAALADANLLDAHGKQINSVNSDRGVVLSVRKDRAKKWTEVILTGESAVFLKKWIQLTNPIRQYMRENDVAGWRKLIVYVSSPLGRPSTLKRSSNMNSTFRSIAMTFESVLGPLAKLVTPSRIRATQGVMEFIRTKNPDDLAKILANDKSTSMRHYLPDCLWEYLSNRWIRIFQNLLIVDATRNTPYMMRATDFKSIDDLDKFLCNHSLTKPELSQSQVTEPKQEGGRLMINASVGVFSLLKSVALSVQRHVENRTQISGLGLYWSEFAKTLGAHIESKSFKDFAIKAIWNKSVATDLYFDLVAANE